MDETDSLEILVASTNVLNEATNRLLQRIPAQQQTSLAAPYSITRTAGLRMHTTGTLTAQMDIPYYSLEYANDYLGGLHSKFTYTYLIDTIAHYDTKTSEQYWWYLSWVKMDTVKTLQPPHRYIIIISC